MTSIDARFINGLVWGLVGSWAASTVAELCASPQPLKFIACVIASFVAWELADAWWDRSKR